MDKSNDKSTSSSNINGSNKPGVTKSSLSISSQTSQNSFFVFGNVFVTNGSENTAQGTAQEAPRLENDEILNHIKDLKHKMEMAERRDWQNSDLLYDIQATLSTKEKRKQKRDKIEKERAAVYNFGESSPETGFNFKMPSKIESIKQQLANQALVNKPYGGIVLADHD